MSARDRVVELMAEAIYHQVGYREMSPSQAKFVAGHVVDKLVGQPGGVLIMNGAVRDVELADRFGPSSWEITTEEHIQDRESWENPSE